MNVSDPELHNDHAWFQEHAPACISGGLTADERARFDQHAEHCPACASFVEAMRASDAALASLFADIRPGADFEDRLLVRLRGARASRGLVHPAVRYAATGIAAALLLGSVGYFANQKMHDGSMPLFDRQG